MRGNAKLILTVDFELFGNGSGCLHDCVQAPLERMADLAERHGARLEIFVEAIEFSVIEENAEQAQAVRAIKRQLCEMLQRGHRLQLHVHPQWRDAKRHNEDWALDMTQWRVGDLQAATLQDLLSRAHHWLRDAVAEVVPEYRCGVFRAGGWCIQPSASLLESLRSMNILMDSSVAPGMKGGDAAAWYDFRDCPRKSWWRTDSDVARIGNGQLLEVPIAAGRVNLFKHLWSRWRRAREGEFAVNCTGTYRSRVARRGGRLNQVQKIWGLRRAMLDYCTLSADLMIDLTQDWVMRHETDGNVPIVAIGHTKNFSSGAVRELDRYLSWASRQPGLQFSSYESWRRSAVPDGSDT